MSMRYAAAYACGQSHLLENLPCQDFAAGKTAGRVSVAALCDGAGSCPQSELAAQCVCAWALEALASEFDALYEAEADALADLLVGGGQAALREKGLENVLCTMLAVACHEDGRWLAAHIGDGYIFVGEEDSQRVLSYPENGMFANETFFLCEADARSHMRTYRGQTPGRFSALLTSDGCGDSLYDTERRAPAPAVEVLMGWLADHDGEAVSRALEHQLNELFSARSDDDLSLALLYKEVPQETDA